MCYALLRVCFDFFVARAQIFICFVLLYSDATRKGNVARFTNHSCEPNVNAVVIPKDKHRTEKAIVFYALKDLDVGDEITYDYKFAFEDGTDTIHCNCGASMCRGRMN